MSVIKLKVVTINLKKGSGVLVSRAISPACLDGVLRR